MMKEEEMSGLGGIDVLIAYQAHLARPHSN